MGYLDKSGLTYFFNKIKSLFVKKTELADVALSGKIADLEQTEIIIFDCGDSTRNI